jgi:hypothetical protein
MKIKNTKLKNTITCVYVHEFEFDIDIDRDYLKQYKKR